METNYLSFVKKIFIFAIIIFSITATLYYVLPKNFITPALPFLLVFFLAITLVSHYLQLKAFKKSFARFTSGFMMITFLKLMLLLAVMLLYVLTHQWDALPFIGWYFIFYVCFTAFEVVSLQGLKDNKS